MLDTLTARISKSFKSSKVTAADLAALLEETKRQSDQSRADATAARARALDPVLTASEAESEYRNQERANFEADRLAAAAEQLESKLAAAIYQEEQDRLLSEYHAVRMQRDAVSKRLRDQAPKALELLKTLATETIEVGAAVDRINQSLPDAIPLLDRPEGHARGFPDHAYSVSDQHGQLALIATMIIPDFANPSEVAWPRKFNRFKASIPQLHNLLNQQRQKDDHPEQFPEG
jgi:hypothetical protein